MSERQETVEDFIALIRKYNALVPAYKWADRLEAAWKREREELREAATEKMLEGATIIDNRGHGNAAAMREALVELTDKVLDYLHRGLIQLPLPLEDATAKARAALSATPRNCDVGTPEELGMRYEAFCRKHFTPDQLGGNCRKCTLKDRRGWSCQLAWAQTPYEAEEGAGE